MFTERFLRDTSRIGVPVRRPLSENAHSEDHEHLGNTKRRSFLRASPASIGTGGARGTFSITRQDSQTPGAILVHLGAGRRCTPGAKTAAPGNSEVQSNDALNSRTPPETHRFQR
jgi:hypothetical protein